MFPALKWAALVISIAMGPGGTHPNLIPPESLTPIVIEKPEVIESTVTFVPIAPNTPVTGVPPATTSSISNNGTCYAEPVTPNTPTGIAGCVRWGKGIASHYGPGAGVAMNFCTWTHRHTNGCGSVRITSVDTGITVIAPVIDFCDCYTTTSDERIVDLQWGVVASLGLSTSQGLYKVEVWPIR